MNASTTLQTTRNSLPSAASIAQTKDYSSHFSSVNNSDGKRENGGRENSAGVRNQLEKEEEPGELLFAEDRRRQGRNSAINVGQSTREKIREVMINNGAKHQATRSKDVSDELLEKMLKEYTLNSGNFQIQVKIFKVDEKGERVTKELA